MVFLIPNWYVSDYKTLYPGLIVHFPCSARIQIHHFEISCQQAIESTSPVSLFFLPISLKLFQTIDFCRRTLFIIEKKIL